MKNKKLLFIVLFAVIVLFALTTKSNASLYLNNLDFYAELDENGNMNVTETWSIRVSDTNTLYKTFKIDRTKYSDITNVKVSEIGKGELTETNTWAYHLEKDTYFGGKNGDGKFEISWGVGLDNSSATKAYKISYTVQDAIKKYDDCAELYWQFVGSDFEINASKITGTIKLPKQADSKDDIRVWGHVKTLNGEIYTTSEDTVQFALDDYSSGNYVEIRIAMPNKIFGTVSKTYSTNMLTSIIEEETKWADEANAVRKRNQKIENILIISFFAGVVLLLVFFLGKTVKYAKILKNTQKLNPTEKLEYFREKPSKYSTPADAWFLYNNGKTIASTSFGNIFSATLLNLSLKGYFKIAVEKNEKEKDETVIYKPQEDITTLQYEEERIGTFVKDAIGNEEKITIKKLQNYIINHPEKVEILINRTNFEIKRENKMNNNYDEKATKEKADYAAKSLIYFSCAIVSWIVLSCTMSSLLWFLPILIVLIVNAILLKLINKKLSNLTQKGIDEREKWKGLKKYMEDFSLLNEKEIPALEVWEEYLVYATVFGIADKVIKQLKLVYPEIENMYNFNTDSYIYLMSHTNFNSSFSRAIDSSISSAASSSMSSGSGGGGGFSGGGGGGRWRRPADGGR